MPGSAPKTISVGSPAERRRKRTEVSGERADALLLASLRAQACLDARAKRGDGPRRPGRPCRARAADAALCACLGLSRRIVASAVADSAVNRRTWRSLCLAHLARLLERDGWRLSRLAREEADADLFGLPAPVKACARPLDGAVAEFAAPANAGVWRVYFDDQPSALLRKAAARIAKADRNRFRTLAVLLAPDRLALDVWRDPRRAARWPRGLMLAYDELRASCMGDRRTAIVLPCPALDRTPEPEPSVRPIVHAPAIVRENVAVGGPNSPYFKLRVEAPELTGILPGQFVMLDTAPPQRGSARSASGWPAFKAAFARMPDVWLKRPFGIHRAFYPGFDPSVYLRRLRLPPSVARLTHTVRPDAFDLFCKVTPRGKGTRQLARLRPGARVRLLGPLGRPFDLDALVARAPREVHAIGGGVGMAPLIFLIQALRYRNIPVRAFVGIESPDRLRYRAGRRRRKEPSFSQDADFTAERRDALVFLDDLEEAGLPADAIFLSCDLPGEPPVGLEPGHCKTGLVSELYADALRRVPKDRCIEAFVCGPEPMMKAIHRLTRPRSIRLHALMEKRMACGIGVCLSCVCETKHGLARVCRDGPVFEASELPWT